MVRNLWFHGPYGQCELPPACIRDCSASGPVDEAVEFWVDRLEFDGPAWLIRRHLKGYGAWSAAELCDHQANRRRLLWIWACNCREGDALLSSRDAVQHHRAWLIAAGRSSLYPLIRSLAADFMTASTTTRAHRPTSARRSRKGNSSERGPSPEEKLVADLIALMEQGTAPWRREWQGHQGSHRNLLTGHAYRGSNPLLLEFGALLKGHTLPLWLGGAQAKANGWFPRKGSSAVRIVRPQLNQRDQCDEQGNALISPEGEPLTTSWVSYKVVPVFNAADLVAATPETQQSLTAAIASALDQAGPPPAATARLEHAEAVLETWPVKTVFGGAVACYSPGADRIAMPAAEAFTSREAFAATWAHEQVHSTGHTSRLARNLSGAMGSWAYAREELVAELGAVIVCQRLQIGSDIQNHAAYLTHWAELLKESPAVLFQVLSAARQAADLIAPEPPEPAAA